MATTYRTPGVYIKEVSVFPPSVAEVETAIPAFVGYTEKAEENGVDLTNVPTRIDSMVEYRELFGGAPAPGAITVTLDDANTPTLVDIDPRFYLFNSLRLFFANGGGKCYIVSVGDYDTTIALGDPSDPDASPGLLVGLDRLKKYDEPTMILFPDAVLLGANGLYDLQKDALKQCGTLQDRFAIFDLYESRATDANFDWEDGVEEFRDQIGNNSLKYGAAYLPYLKTTIPYDYEYSDVSLQRSDGTPLNLADLSSDPRPVERLEAAIGDRTTINQFVEDPITAGASLSEGYANIANSNDAAEIENRLQYLTDVAQEFVGLPFNDTSLNTQHKKFVDPGEKLEDIVAKMLQYDLDYFADDESNTPVGVVNTTDYGSYTSLGGVSAQPPADTIYADSEGTPGATESERATNARRALRKLFEELVAGIVTLQEAADSRVVALEEEVEDSNAIYANVIKAIGDEGSILPPSGAIAGVYSYVDRTRGVWKSPANVSLSSVVGPTAQIDDPDQHELNVDPNGGKSVNAIRSFSGRGTLVWGARTLAGNSNEWRYISVRRFFNMVEESIKKSTSWAVFEGNDATLWTKVKGMVENYLIQKWQDGALAGAKADEAFFVHVGLGKTMTAQDVLEGRLIVQVGLAVVRPAEFIIFEFMHKLQES